MSSEASGVSDSGVHIKQFGTFGVDLDTGELRRDGVKQKLQEQPFQVLAMLLERPGEVVTREALRNRLWPADTFVDFEHSLNTAIKKLRSALSDSAENPRFVETLPRRGYRFIAPVSSIPRSVDAAAPAAARSVPGDLLDSAAASPLADRASQSPLRIAVVVLAALMIAAAWAVWRPRPAAKPEGPTPAPTAHVAVLPLKVLTAGDTERHLGLGIADAVITRLANVQTLKVLPTAVVIKYDSPRDAIDPQAAGRALAAEHVLAGTLRKTDEMYRVSMQLIRTVDGAAIWGETYDVARGSLLTIEDKVSAEVTEALRVRLAASNLLRTVPAPPRNPAAYESYLQGRALLVNYSEVKMRAAIESFERAIQLDPQYASASAGLAMALAWFSVRYAYEKDALEWGRRAEAAALRALVLDPNLAEAHLAIANAAGTLYGHFNWSRLLAGTDQALKLDPQLELAHVARARALYHLGLFEAARAAAAAALQLNPASSVETERLIVASELFSGGFADARARAERLISQSDAPAFRLYFAQALFYLGDRKRAADLLRVIKRGGTPDIRSQAALASVLAATGQPAEAKTTIDAVIASSYTDHHVAYSLGAAFAQLHRPDDALRWLRVAISDGFPCYPWFESDPLLEPIRDHPAYRQLMSELRATYQDARARYGFLQ